MCCKAPSTFSSSEPCNWALCMGGQSRSGFSRLPWTYCASTRARFIPLSIVWNIKAGLRRSGEFLNLAVERDSTGSRLRARSSSTWKPRHGPGTRAQSAECWTWPDMDWGDLKLRIRAMLHRSRVEAELEEELQSHLEMQARKNQSAGNDPLEASRLARVQFGAMDKAREECRDARGTRLIEDALADVRHALRGFRRAPVFVLTVVATIAFPLGLITALFTIFNAYVLRPVAVRDPRSIYQFTWTDRRGTGHSFSWPEFEAFRDGNPAFSEVAATRPLFARVEGYPLSGELVTVNYFRMLGVNAVAGRTLLPEDGAAPGSAPVVVLSHLAWQNKLGGEPDIVGKTVVIRGHPLQVIGIIKPEFMGLNEAPSDFWVPLTMAAQLEDGPNLFGSDHPERLDIVGRLRDDLAVKQAETALGVWVRGAMDQRSQEERPPGIVLESRTTPIRPTVQLVVATLPVLVAFLLVLLIACANIASMML